MRVFLISKSKPGFGAGFHLENALGIPGAAEPSKAEIPSWFFACGILIKGLFCLKLASWTHNALCAVHQIGYRPELELIYRDYSAG